MKLGVGNNMSLHDRYRKISDIRKYRESQAKQKFIEDSKDRLEIAIRKKFETSLIGSLDSIEQYFGGLWNSTERTPQQKRFYALWRRLRTEILDKGNFQLRSLLKEIEEYKVEWEGKKITFRDDMEQ